MSSTKNQVYIILFIVLMIPKAYCQLDSTYRTKYSYEGWSTGGCYATHIINFNKEDSTFKWKLKRTIAGCFLNDNIRHLNSTGKYQIINKTLVLNFTQNDTLSSNLREIYPKLKIKKNKLKAFGSEKKKRKYQEYYINFLRASPKPYNPYSPNQNHSFLRKTYRTIRFPFFWVYTKGIYPIIKPEYFKPIEIY